MKPPSKWSEKPCPTCGTARTMPNGEWLRYVRQRANVTLREMARRTGFTAPYLCDIEYNRRNGSPAIRAEYERLAPSAPAGSRDESQEG